MNDPMSEAFALSEADRAAIAPKVGHWNKAGVWKYREFGREVQLRSMRLPHLQLDVFRTEAEELFAALGAILSKPTPLPYRVPWLERLRMWFRRAVWNRQHARELDEHRGAIVKQLAEQFEQHDAEVMGPK